MIVDKEFKSLIDPLTREELEGLEQKILTEGFKGKVVVWQEQDILLDGHNRVAICKKHNIKYDKRYISLPDRNAAINWIIDNQLSRRNLSPNQAAYLRGKKYLAEKQKPWRPKKEKKGATVAPPSPEKKGATVAPFSQSTREKIAKETKVSPRTIARDGLYAQAVDQVSGKLDMNKVKAEPRKDVITLAKKPDEEQEQIINIVKEKDIPIKQAIKAKKIKDSQKKIAAGYKTSADPPLIIHGDASNFKGKCDLLITDPPYMTDVDNINEFAQWLPEKLQCVKKTGFAFVFIGAYPEELNAYLNIAMPEQVLVWTYRNTLGAAPKNKYKLNWQAILFYRMPDSPGLDCPITNELWAVQDINAPDGRHEGRYHTWEKPMKLAERLIRHTTKTGDMILDCYAGTGTFLLAGTSLGRKTIGYEIDKTMIDIAIKRGCKLG